MTGIDSFKVKKLKVLDIFAQETGDIVIIVDADGEKYTYSFPPTAIKNENDLLAVLNQLKEIVIPNLRMQKSLKKDELNKFLQKYKGLEL